MVEINWEKQINSTDTLQEMLKDEIADMDTLVSNGVLLQEACLVYLVWSDKEKAQILMMRTKTNVGGFALLGALEVAVRTVGNQIMKGEVSEEELDDETSLERY